MVEAVVWWQNPWYVLMIVGVGVLGYLIIYVIRYLVNERAQESSKDSNLEQKTFEDIKTLTDKQASVLEEKLGQVFKGGTEFEAKCLKELEELANMKRDVVNNLNLLQQGLQHIEHAEKKVEGRLRLIKAWKDEAKP